MKTTISILILGLFFFGVGCKLDPETYNQLPTTEFPSNENQLLRTVAPAYTTLKGYVGDYWQAQEVPTDECVVPTRGGDWADGGAPKRLHLHTWTNSSGSQNNVWGFCYNGISRINQILYQLGQTNIQVDALPQKIAELKVLRAYYYYLLLDNYRNVYLTTDFLDTSQPKQVTPTETFQFVEKEIRANISLLETKPAVANYGLVTQGVAHTILAKLYLNAQVYIGQAKWTEAIAECDAVISSNNYSLSPDFMTNFQRNNETSTENIFVIPFDQQLSTGFGQHIWTLHYNSRLTYQLTATPNNGYCTTPEYYRLFDATDARRKIFLAGQQYAADGTPLNTRTNQPLVFTIDFITKDPWNDNGTGGAPENDGVRVLKYVPAPGTGGDLSNDYAIFRYADILMMKAESLIRLGRASEALTLVNQVRTRSLGTAAAFTSVDLDSFYAERRREFGWEAFARQDMIRFGKFGGVWTFHATPTDATKQIFPIPLNVLTVIPGLKQNPGY